MLGLPLQRPHTSPRPRSESRHANHGGLYGGGGGGGGGRESEMQGGQALFAHGFAMGAEEAMHQVYLEACLVFYDYLKFGFLRLSETTI
jgi:hypothetical protein